MSDRKPLIIFLPVTEEKNTLQKAAACGLTVSKKGARLVTGVPGASDIFEIVGVDLDSPLTNASKNMA